MVQQRWTGVTCGPGIGPHGSAEVDWRDIWAGEWTTWFSSGGLVRHVCRGVDHMVQQRWIGATCVPGSGPHGQEGGLGGQGPQERMMG